MLRLRRSALPLSLALLTSLAGCGDDGAAADADTTDAVPTGPCREFLGPAGFITSFPGSFEGDVLGAGTDHAVAAMDCSTEETFYTPAGEDQVVRLDGLTPGAAYALELEAPADLSFYVTTGGCDEGDIPAGECLLFVDAQAGGTELSQFVAPDSGRAYVVIDHFVAANPITDGSYALSVFERECEMDAECTSAETPYCNDFRCVTCTNSFHCETTERPVCEADLNVCVEGHGQCTGDDASPPENADDGPAGAVLLTATDGVPALADAKICGLPNTGSDLIGHQDAEVDFYKFDLPADAKRAASLTWASNDDDLDLYLFDANGRILESSFFGFRAESLIVEGQEAGTYYLAVAKFEENDPIAPEAVDYSLTLAFPECEDSFDCPTTLDPVCGPALTCQPDGALCSGDDIREPDDGQAVATPLTSGVQVSGAVCNSPASERDFFSIVAGAGDSLNVSLAWVAGGATDDLDIAVYSDDGTLFGTSFYLNPEQVSLTFLPAGTYFIEVNHAGGSTSVALAYDLIATVTPTGGCVSATNCAAEFSTQIYRGNCVTAAGPNLGACTAIAPGARALGVACDSGDDCTSGLCSNLIFQQNAQDSVCTVECVADSTCTTAHGAGFSCTRPFVTNKCHPDCAGNLECGVNTNSTIIDTGEPWDYLLCNAGVCELEN